MPQIVNIAIISTHAPAGGATIIAECEEQGIQFLLTPLREGRRHDQTFELASSNFYSRPCGRGDYDEIIKHWRFFDFYSRPCGRGDPALHQGKSQQRNFYSRPCGRGDRSVEAVIVRKNNFYSRPCGRGDTQPTSSISRRIFYFYSRPCGRGDRMEREKEDMNSISTHAPAGGATQGWKPKAG